MPILTKEDPPALHRYSRRPSAKPTFGNANFAPPKNPPHPSSPPPTPRAILLPVPPRIHRTALPARWGRCPGRVVKTRAAGSGAVQKVSPSRMKHGGACLCGTQGDKATVRRKPGFRWQRTPARLHPKGAVLSAERPELHDTRHRTGRRRVPILSNSTRQPAAPRPTSSRGPDETIHATGRKPPA